MNKKRIQLSICTYKRPLMLRRCLESVLKTNLPANVLVSIVVIDNDQNHTAMSIVEELSPDSPVDIHYINEIQRGIPIARNVALDRAIELSFDYLIFIDDDEYVDQHWLPHLVAYAEQKGGQAVIHGRVIPDCPPDVPNYLAPFFSKNKFNPTDQRLNTCATNNVLIPLRPISNLDLRFDESRPLAGGTDTIFFCSAHRSGIEIFACAEAVVHETIPPQRISIQWLSRRKFRAGLNIGKRKVAKGKSAGLVILSASLQTVFRSFCAAVLLLLTRKHLAAKQWLKACRTAGTALGTMGLRVDAYKITEGC